MRKIRHLSYCDYVIPMGQKSNRVTALSGQANTVLERTWHTESLEPFRVEMHAKFNSDTMNGVQLLAYLSKSGKRVSSVVTTFNLYRVSESSWAETLVSSVSATSEQYAHIAYIDQSTLGLNELSGRECYAFECVLSRKRNSFRRKMYFNSLGIYDSANELRKSVERLEIMKVDE